MLNQLLSQNFMQNTVHSYLVALCIFAALVAVIYVIKVVLLHRLKKWAAQTTTTFDDFIVLHIEKTLIPLLMISALILSAQHLTIPAAGTKLLHVLSVVVLMVYVLKFAMSLVDYGIAQSWKNEGDGAARRQSMKGVVVAVKVVLVGIAVILIMDNMGVKISALVAGLGIGGVAVAFASQAVLGDLFSFFVILFDRPFEIGDVIVVDDLQGTVEHVGVKTTRVRSVGGEQLIFSNTTLTNAKLRNYKRMSRRRVAFKLGVTYQTTAQNMKLIPELIKNIITATPGAAFERAHFASYGDSALIYEIVYHVLSADYNQYMDTHQSINFCIKEEFAKHNIEFAYPTQTVYIAK